MVSKEEMIETIKKWYDFQLLTGKIRLNYYRLIIKSIPYLSIQTIYAFFSVSRVKLEEEKNRDRWL